MMGARLAVAIAVFAALVSLLPTAEGATLNPSQESVLLSIKATLGSFDGDDTWTAGSDCSDGTTTWAGVTCNEDGFPTALNLSSKAIFAEFPDAVVGLPFLQTLDLSFNSLWGSISYDLTARCISLTTILLNDNLLTGTLPNVFGGQENPSIIFNVANNYISGTPYIFFNCPFDTVDLRNNCFNYVDSGCSSTDQKDAETCSYAANCGSESTPCTRVCAVTTKGADLVSSEVECRDPSPAIPNDVDYLLQILNNFGSAPEVLTSSWLPTNLCPSWFGLTCYGRRVRAISLPSLSIKGSIATSFNLLTDLTSLDLSSNQLYGFATRLATLTSLVSLNISNNYFTGILPGAQNFQPNAPFPTVGTPGVYFTQPLILYDASNNFFVGSPDVRQDGAISSSIICPGTAPFPNIDGNCLNYPIAYTNCPTRAVPRPDCANFCGSDSFKGPCNSGQNLGKICVPTFDEEDVFLGGQCGCASNPYNPFTTCPLSTAAFLFGPLGTTQITNAFNSLTSFVGRDTWEAAASGYTKRCNKDYAGLFCDTRVVNGGTTNRVVRIDLSGRSVSSTLGTNNVNQALNVFLNPSNWQHLTYLDLSNNNLVGTLPTTIASNTILQYLNLANNKLTGTIPAGAGWSGLRYLNLSGNYFTGDFQLRTRNVCPVPSLDFASSFTNGTYDVATNCVSDSAGCGAAPSPRSTAECTCSPICPNSPPPPRPPPPPPPSPPPPSPPPPSPPPPSPPPPSPPPPSPPPPSPPPPPPSPPPQSPPKPPPPRRSPPPLRRPPPPLRRPPPPLRRPPPPRRRPPPPRRRPPPPRRRPPPPRRRRHLSLKFIWA